MTEDNIEWRVTDPNASHPGAQEFLPNPTLDIQIGDLEHAVRAEAIIDRWGGHAGTVEHRLRFNENEWLDIPLLETTPPGKPPESYLFQNTAVVQIPIDHLSEGKNTFQGTSGGQTYADFGWGQWGWTGIIVRVYYESDNKQGEPAGTITAPSPESELGQNPELRVSPSSGDIQRVDFIAHYRGVDEDGDGYYRDWHRGYYATRGTTDRRDTEMRIEGHCGTARSAPWTVRCNTKHIPSQDDIKIIARIKAKNGLWFVTDVVEDLRLDRDNEYVQMITTHEMPQQAHSRKGNEKTGFIHIPPDFPVGSVTDAHVFWRTWNGQNYHWSFDGYESEFRDADHNFKQQFFDLPIRFLKTGRVPVSVMAETEHHGVEALWPGPTLILRISQE
jgi:hypothetical protein